MTDTSQRESLFGPVADGPGGQRFDFTLLFEQSILSLGPSAVLLLALPVRVVQLLRQRQKVLKSYRVIVQLCAYMIFGALQLALLIQWASTTGTSGAKSVSIAASALGVLVASCLCALSYLEHNRSVRPSPILCTYLLFSGAFDAVQCRTLWLLDSHPGLATVFTCMLGFKVLLFALEMQNKRSLLLQAWRWLGPESTSGVITRSLFWWLNDLMIRGFSATLSLRSLWDTDEQLQSRGLLQQIQRTWAVSREKPSRYALLRAVLNSLRWPLATCAFPRLCLIGFKFSQPFLIKRMVSYVDGHQGTRQQENGYGLIGATALIYIGTALSTGFYQHKVFRSMTMVRGLLVSMVLHETVHLDAYSNTGSGTLTLITSDVDGICAAFENLHEIWANVVEVGIAIWLLELELSIGCLGPVAVVFVCSIVTAQIARLTGPAIKNWNEAIQERVSVTSRILASIKETKMLGMAAHWTEAIQKLRVKELNLSKRSRTLMMCMNVLGNTPAKIAPVATFGIAILVSKQRANEQLNTSTAFAALTIISLIVTPLAMLMYAVPGFVGSLGCFERIQTFLNGINDTRCTKSQELTRLVPNSGEALELTELSENDPHDNTLTIRHADFMIKQGESPLLKNISIEIKSRSFTIVAGKTGSGKTTLLRAILGELHYEGYVRFPRVGVAYCAQTAWLVNSTIRRNILGQSDLDEQWYSTVISACALDADFAQLDKGDLTIVGSKGNSLSGGQKQRISLARAIYSRLPVMVIDDVLSGLDWRTRRHVWDRVFGSTGLLRGLGSTVIFATNTLTLLDDENSMVILGVNGRILRQGKVGALRNDASTQSLFQSNLDAAKSVTGVSLLEEASDDSESHGNTQFDPETDEQEIAGSSGAGDSSLYKYYLRLIGWKYGVPLFAMIVVHAAMGVLSDIWLRIWTDANDKDSHMNTARYYGVYALIAFLALVVIGLDTWFMFVQIIPRSGQHLHFTLLRTVMRAPLSFFSRNASGDLINRFSKDMTLVDRDLPSNFWQCIGALFSTIATAGLVLQGSSYLGIILPVALAFLYVLQKFYLRTSRQLRLLDLQATAPLYTHLLETLDGLSTIRAFGWQTATTDQGIRLLDQAQKPHYLLFCIQRWLALVLDLSVAASGVILVTLCVTLPQSTSSGSVALALVNLLGLNQLLTHVISTWTTLETSLGAIARLKTFEKVTPQESNGQQATEPGDTWPATGRLDVQDITASYSADSDESIRVLHGLSFRVEPGDKVAICGRTGSGKSSLLLTLFRLLEVESGCITIDGLDIQSIDHNILRRRLISIPQEATIFPGSLRSNLTSTLTSADSSFSTDAHLISVLRKVTLWDRICLGGNLDTDIADLVLSHGQRQLLCLARAILRKDSSSILIVDEAMSAVDEHTEEVMARIIESEFSKHTVIAVAHRLHTVTNYDKIVVLEQGRVVEVGSPTELLKLSHGKFRALFEASGIRR